MSTATAAAATAESSRQPTQVVYAQETPEGVGAIVRRSIGSPALRNLSPFLMLLSHGAVGSLIIPMFVAIRHTFAQQWLTVIQRGQTTVTYVLQGMMQHEDSTGNSGKLETGDVQWMTAGKGIMHSEMPLFDDDPAKRVDAVGLQLWVDLPAAQKFCEPSYQEKKAKDIDTARPADGVTITVISGESHGVKGFVRPVGGCWYLDIRLSEPGATVFQPLPAGWTAFAYILSGRLLVGDDPAPKVKHHTVVMSAGAGEHGVRLARAEDPFSDVETRFVLIAGEPLDQPVVQYGPFVVNTNRQAMEAVADFRNGRNGFEGAAQWESKIGAALRQR